jgi:uncharacterized protein (DUF1501 family)
VNRREFLWKSSLLAGAVTLGDSLFGRIARAASEKDHYFVFCYFEGGWDHLLGLDPRDPAEFSEDRIQETGIQPGYDRLPAQYSRSPIDAGPFQLGPCVGELAQVADLFSVVRGVDMATLTHEVGRRYFLTGRRPSGVQARGSSVATVAAAQIGADRPVPHLAQRCEAYNVDQPSFAGALSVAAVGHVQYILQEDLGLPTDIPPNVKGALGAYWRKHRDCAQDTGPGATHLGQLYEEARARAREVVTSHLHRNFEFDSPELAAVRERYGIQQGQIETPAGRAALAAQALKVGLSRVVSVALSTDLDTHDNTWANNHSANLEAGFTALARLLTDLRDSEAPGGGSFLSKTTILCFSEFGRTPRLNERQGRDHHLGNCALVAGAGIRTGQVIGGSSDLGMGPELVDLATGRPSETGISLLPEHVTSTVLVAAGLDASYLRSEPIPALIRL